MNYPRRVVVDLEKSTLRVWTIKRGTEVEHLYVHFAPDNENEHGIEVIVLTPSDGPYDRTIISDEGVNMVMAPDAGLSDFSVTFAPKEVDE